MKPVVESLAAMAKPKESVRLFKSDFCEKFSHVHPATPAIIFGPVVLWCFWQSVPNLGLVASLGIAGLGIAFWTLAEYLIHRYLFHYEFTSELGKRFHYIMHGNHHDVPDDPTRLVMPPVAGIVLASVFYGMFRLVMGPETAVAFFGGFIFGYLCYDYIHFYVHHFTPKSGLGRALKQGHMVHHYARVQTRWGVSSPLWDIILGTLQSPPKPAPREEQSAV